MENIRTRIVCTLGTRDPSDPAIPQNAPDFLERLTEAGMDVARLNLSHSRAWERGEGAPGYEPEDHWLESIGSLHARREAAGQGPRVGVLADLQGVKLRLAIREDDRRDGWAIESGDKVVIGLCRGGEKPCIDGGPLLPDDIRKGLEEAGDDGLLMHIGDGDILMSVDSVEGDTFHGTVVVGGAIFDRKGVTFRGVDISVDTVLTEKDRHDLVHWVVPRFLEGTVTFVALSFVRSAEDVRALRHFVEGLLAVSSGDELANNAMAKDAERRLRELPEVRKRMGELLAEIPTGPSRRSRLRIPVIAKMETREAAAASQAIVREADGIMVARGDLGLQCEPGDVPRLQKEILRQARRAGKPVIVATQMLDSMERHWEPRRPEASDVFNAVLDGTDAVMLSGETSVGRYPVRAVEVLSELVHSAETWSEPTLSDRAADLRRFYDGVREERAWRGEHATVTDHVCYLAAESAPVLGCKAIVALTMSGGTARMLARFRPRVPVMASVHDDVIASRLTLAYGVTGESLRFVPSGTPVDIAFTDALRAMRERGMLQAGDRVLVLCGRPLGGVYGTNLLSVETVPEASRNSRDRKRRDDQAQP
ncbi:MAG: pyruvate kinase [Planctomycetota bacterium]